MRSNRGRLAVVVGATVSFFVLAPGVASATPGTTVTLEPTRARPGTTVSISGFGWAGPAQDPTPPIDPSCSIYLDEVPVKGATCSVDTDGFLGGTFVVPDRRPGFADVHVCRVNCATNDGQHPEATARLEVLGVVPNLIGLTLELAGTVVRDAGLRLGTVDNPSGAADAVVVLQKPPPGNELPAGGEISIQLRPTPQSASPSSPTPPSVVVPDLRGLSLAAATGRVVQLDLVLRANASAGTVVGQDPPPGRPVSRGTAISVTLRPEPTPSDDLVTVPELTGKSIDEARAALREVDLTLQSALPEGVVASQSPAPGGRVPRGSFVTVALRPSPSPRPSPPPASSTSAPQPQPTSPHPLIRRMFGLLAVLGLGAAAVTRQLRRSRARHEPQVPTGQVHAVAEMDIAGRTTTTRPARTRTIRLEPQVDRGTTTLTGVT